MNPVVFILVIIAAITHALWNFIAKKVSGNFIIFWYGSYIVSLLLFIYTLFYLFNNSFNFAVLPFLFTSAAVHLVSYVTSLYTYSHGDISTVYPIARGTGVAGTAIISFFFLQEIISVIAAAGISAIFTGIMFIGFSKIKNQKFDTKTFLVAILTGVCIIVYSLTDKQGVLRENPIVYINIMDLIALTPLMPLANKNGFKTSLKILKKNLKESLIIGLGSVGTYIIILWALRIDKRASYIVSMREFSVVIASIMGFIFLKEKPTIFKIIGIISITAGLILIKSG
jgi:drug/metabolite transporter (DMT)-like permease